MAGEIFAANTSDCQVFTALIDNKEENDELFEISLNLKEIVFGTGLHNITENTVVITIFDLTLEGKTKLPFIVFHYNCIYI